MTTVEAAFDGEHLAVTVNGHRLRLLWLLSGAAWVGVVVAEWARRRSW